uniref:hypothetical protein n=1 Tax=Pararhizobium sp. IMCC3301 TaxID=3067904 RepID=UPI0027411FCC|nr:hypothetical protein [Pararhizobium sp. IMCC3301]
MSGLTELSYARLLQQAHKQRLYRMGGMPYARKADGALHLPDGATGAKLKLKPAKIRARRVYHREPGPKMKAILFPVSIASHPKVAPKSFAGDPRDALSLAKIMDEICVRYGLAADEIRQVKGRRYVKLAKHEFCWRAWHETGCVVTRIAKFLRSENHALVSRGICSHQARRDRGLL